MAWNLLTAAGASLTPHNLWSAWSFEPSVIIPMAFAVLIYLWGMTNIWRRAGAGRGITWQRTLSFLGAMLSLLMALASPLDALSEQLFSAHMVQHLLLILVAAPLLVMSDFPLAVLWALPRHRAQALRQGAKRSRPLSRLWQALTSPVTAWILFAIPLWVWHTRALFDAALQNGTIHTVEHLGFLLTGMLFWWVLFKHTQPDHLHYGMAIPYLFTTMLHCGVLGALMTFTSQPWYPFYAAHVSTWGTTPMDDQQLAGLVMWIPGGLVFTLLTIGYFAAWLRALERRSAQQARGAAPARQKSE